MSDATLSEGRFANMSCSLQLFLSLSSVFHRAEFYISMKSNFSPFSGLMDGVLRVVDQKL